MVPAFYCKVLVGDSKKTTKEPSSSFTLHRCGRCHSELDTWQLELVVISINFLGQRIFHSWPRTGVVSMIRAKSTSLLIYINRCDTPLTCQIKGWRLLSSARTYSFPRLSPQAENSGFGQESPLLWSGRSKECPTPDLGQEWFSWLGLKVLIY